MQQLRLSIIGFGTVGQGLAELLASKAALLKQDYGLDVKLVSVANSRHGGLIPRLTGANALPDRRYPRSRR